MNSVFRKIWISGGIQTLMQYPITTNTREEKYFKINFPQPFGVSNHTYFYEKDAKKFKQGQKKF